VGPVLWPLSYGSVFLRRPPSLKLRRAAFAGWLAGRSPPSHSVMGWLASRSPLRRAKAGALSRSRTCTERSLSPPPLPIGLPARARRGIRTRTASDLSRSPLPLGYAGVYLSAVGYCGSRTRIGVSTEIAIHDAFTAVRYASATSVIRNFRPLGCGRNASSRNGGRRCVPSFRCPSLSSKTTAR
jgi:hypothetical protein